MGISKDILQENNGAKIGLIVSSVIIAGALLPNIKSPYFSMDNMYSLPILMLGVGMFFIFMGIKTNTRVKFKEDDNYIHMIEVLPREYDPLSKVLFIIAAFFMMSFFITLNLIIKLI